MSKYRTDKGILIEEFMEDAENPRDEMEHYSKFFTFLNRHRSPDNHNYDDFGKWLHSIMSHKSACDILRLFAEGDFNGGARLLIEYAEKRGYVLLPVWKYEHSGVEYCAAEKNPSNDWFDSCFAGVIYCTKNDLYKNYGKRCSKNVREAARCTFRSEVEEYSYYANGEVFQYCMEGDEPEWICGFYGGLDVNGAKDYFGIENCEIII